MIEIIVVVPLHWNSIQRRTRSQSPSVQISLIKFAQSMACTTTATNRLIITNRDFGGGGGELITQ